ncbi:hypothetical protein SISSUDRAFT_1035125 [Sistotremastrum suecicum HHB10207 ss-3]|uniref:Uncharacterized protein n=1 Tax=Sistotremastrum suecicum HHB10207 ss-3 TaxID=1314776 RepID=A0A166B7B4_9AGAM|nr:hypothetical protein SISSUDRAFT_1035125 [Sistotremastrum suecicum HHB10207 ss-3]
MHISARTEDLFSVASDYEYEPEHEEDATVSLINPVEIATLRKSLHDTLGASANGEHALTPFMNVPLYNHDHHRAGLFEIEEEGFSGDTSITTTSEDVEVDGLLGGMEEEGESVGEVGDRGLRKHGFVSFRSMDRNTAKRTLDDMMHALDMREADNQLEALLQDPVLADDDSFILVSPNGKRSRMEMEELRPPTKSIRSLKSCPALRIRNPQRFSVLGGRDASIPSYNPRAALFELSPIPLNQRLARSSGYNNRHLHHSHLSSWKLHTHHHH